ncbi:MAG: hypothetical protein Q8P31_03025 [Bacillota bacterium]|nr:hypothetical protein [Bacillota bacterium]
MVQRKPSKLAWIPLALAAVLIVLGASYLLRADQDRKPTETLLQQMQRLVAAGDLAGALALAPQIRGPERPAAAAAFVRWAGGRANPTRADAEQSADAYLAAAELDPQRTDVYVRLVDLVTAWRLGSHAHRGSAVWMEAFFADPTRCDHPEFAVGESLGRLADLFDAVDAADRNPTDAAANVEAAHQHLLSGNTAEARRYATRARELAPGRLDVLSLLADVGMLDPVSAETVVNISLPLRASMLADIRGGMAAVTGYQDEVDVAYVVALPGGEIKARIERVSGIAISPCGRYVAYASPADLGEPCPITVLDLETDETRLLLETIGAERGIRWSPDGSMIAISSMEGLILVGADGSDRRVVMPATRLGDTTDWSTWAWPQWFAGGLRVSAQKLGWEYLGEVQAYDLTTETTSVVLRMGPGQYEVGTVSWAPGGDRMALNYRRYEADFLWTVAMVDAGGDAADATIAVSGDTDVDPITWSPDGKHLLVRMGNHLWLWEEATRKLSLVPGEPYIFSVWTDENIIYFLSEMGGRLVGIRMSGV